MCLATDMCLSADPGVASSIPAQSHTSVEIDHEIISKVILLPSAESFKKGCCQFCLFVFFLYVPRPKSTAMVMAGRSVHLARLFPGQA